MKVQRLNKTGLPQLSQGWFEVPDAIQWLERSFDLDAAPPADTAVQRWSLFGSCMRPTAVEEEETEVVFLWGRSFSSALGVLKQIMPAIIFQQISLITSSRGNRTCLLKVPGNFQQKSGSGVWKVVQLGIFSPGPGAFAFQFSSQIGLQ